MPGTRQIGEIIESTSTKIKAESDAFLQPPPLGSLVKAKGADASGWIYGVVSFGTTVSLDPGRQITRRSTPSVHDEDVYKEHPQLEHTLRTVFEAVLVGYVDKERHVYRHLPAQPPPLHYSIYRCTPEEIIDFTEEFGYFRILLAHQGDLPPEQLLASHVRRVYENRGKEMAWLKRATKEVTRLMKNDYDRLLSVLLAVEPG